MSAHEMITYANREEEVGHFQNWLSENGVDISNMMSHDYETGVRERIYGPVQATNMEYFRTHEVEPEIAVLGMRVLGIASQRAVYEYTHWPGSYIRKLDENCKRDDTTYPRELCHVTRRRAYHGNACGHFARGSISRNSSSFG
jgi:hypothetical protein